MYFRLAFSSAQVNLFDNTNRRLVQVHGMSPHPSSIIECPLGTTSLINLEAHAAPKNSECPQRPKGVSAFKINSPNAEKARPCTRVSGLLTGPPKGSGHGSTAGETCAPPTRGRILRDRNALRGRTADFCLLFGGLQKVRRGAGAQRPAVLVLRPKRNRSPEKYVSNGDLTPFLVPHRTLSQHPRRRETKPKTPEMPHTLHHSGNQVPAG